MRNLILSAALAGTALTLAACSGETEDAADTAPDAAMTDDGMADTGMADSSDVMDASTVTVDELTGSTGMSPELAEAIVAGQPYDSATALNEVLLENVGEDEAATIRESVFVPVNLNSATREDIALIPGMTDRMIGEFLEYRPYADMETFDREIGKYVDEAEVARFRQYVTL